MRVVANWFFLSNQARLNAVRSASVRHCLQSSHCGRLQAAADPAVHSGVEQECGETSKSLSCTSICCSSKVCFEWATLLPTIPTNRNTLCTVHTKEHSQENER